MTSRVGYFVVTFVVAILVIFGFVTRLLLPAIPPPKPNRVPGESSDYFVQGETQAVNWRAANESAFADASRLGKPIFLVVGSPWSKLARDVDKDAFSFREVQNYLNFHFVCVRVDSFERPDFMNAYLPISRLTTGFLPGLQIWILDSHGRLYGFIGQTNSFVTLDHNALLAELEKARSTFERLQRGETKVPDVQSRDLAMVTSSPFARPNFPRHLDLLRQEQDPVNGGFPSGSYQIPRPNSWKYMLQTGKYATFKQSASPFMRSPMVDLLDGGFFRLSETRDWKSVQFDKVAVTNAELMVVFAMGGSLMRDTLQTQLAERAFDSLNSEFVRNGLIAGCRVGDEGSLNRSARSSFSPRRLSSLLTGSDREWAATNLGLDARRNPRMVPYLVTPAFTFGEHERCQRVLAALRTSPASEAPRFAGQGLLDVSGFVVARLIESARIWNDASRLREALTRFEALDRFKAKLGVTHGLSGENRKRAYLSDYLAYSDAALQAYLATGRSSYLDDGLAALLKAHALFLGDVPGEYFVRGPTKDSLAPPDSRGVQIEDTVCESYTAQMIRLCQAYGLLSSDADSGAGRRNAQTLLRFAADSVGRFARITNSTGCQVSGFFCAALEVHDDAVAVAVGPKALTLSRELARRIPMRMAAPALGSVRRDLQRLQPGVYIVARSRVEGPLDVDGAVRRLGKALNYDQPEDSFPPSDVKRETSSDTSTSGPGS